MFTGIVEDLGTVVRLDRGADFAHLTVDSPVVVTDRTAIGESIAVNGVCLTVTAVHGTAFTADVMHETLRRSSLGTLRRGDHVAVERAMPADGRFSGHIVSGHIDGTGVVESITPDGIATVYTIRAPYELMRFIAEKGSIAVEGISLTVTTVTETAFGVSLIPHTASHTVLVERGVGDIVNLETDPIAKYVNRLLALPSRDGDADKGGSGGSGAITENFLAEHGF
ncbi:MULTISPECIES: riboflavin synthase [unclassified Bifidobacterium]|uniref:riboflavin synthase n=1 Tax=unclassified Bifidobacterium TaxID=2608897 RepID=UPI00112BF665|nr:MULTISPECIES: riboflavin synthase [unclassified Bifidobacterium]TPF78813.1 riboflavin synthase subunit alpha [Bifidobacterium sp. UTCIF-1]TPF80694.1 riboflavin synthase subunit alpha [Bifidobacterium sp. UTCIF-24]TPF82598.1 riboflavin synthase subunit alpha [Bifidobacterium sp. UTCIF-3]TPF84739.1 riboflavin synthase subunit alpha [Bifidobacterium sp. UTCIF-36]TPF90127.1 riboflavin synthase subunit alpha [Bifidobacterium sp. UTBIF-56]